MLREKPQFFGALAVAALALVMAGLIPPLSGQPAATANGKALFGKRCGGCHAANLDKEGPRLGGVYGRPAGSVPSFQYSDALKGAKFTWNDELLEKWLTDPDQLIPDNNMAFHLENGDERREIITYLKQISAK
jgi:cytochrome c